MFNNNSFMSALSICRESDETRNQNGDPSRLSNLCFYMKEIIVVWSRDLP